MRAVPGTACARAAVDASPPCEAAHELGVPVPSSVADAAQGGAPADMARLPCGPAALGLVAMLASFLLWATAKLFGPDDELARLDGGGRSGEVKARLERASCEPAASVG